MLISSSMVWACMFSGLSSRIVWSICRASSKWPSRINTEAVANSLPAGFLAGMPWPGGGTWPACSEGGRPGREGSMVGPLASMFSEGSEGTGCTGGLAGGGAVGAAGAPRSAACSTGMKACGAGTGVAGGLAGGSGGGGGPGARGAGRGGVDRGGTSTGGLAWAWASRWANSSLTSMGATAVSAPSSSS